MNFKHLSNLLVKLTPILFVLNSQASQPTCQSLFSEDKTALLFKDLNANNYSHADLQPWVKYTEQIKTLDDYFQFLNLLNDLSHQRFSPNTNNVSGDQRGAVAVINRLNKIDHISPLLRLTKNLDLSTRQKILENFQAIYHGTSYETPDLIKMWKAEEMALNLVLFPTENIQKYIQQIDQQRNFVQFHFTPSIQIALASLPPSLLKWTQKVIAEQIKIERQDNPVGAAKLKRRHLEAVQFILFSDKFNNLWNQLKTRSTIDAQSLIQLVNNYWKQSSEEHIQNSKSQYDFSKAIEVATQIQRDLNNELKNSYVEIYGSFVNGKANLENSDIDVHFGKELMERYVSYFGERNLDYSNLEQLRQNNRPNLEDAIRLGEILIETEKNIGNLIDRNEIKKSQLMTIVPIHPKNPGNSFYEPKEYMLYNPLSLKVYRDKIILQIYQMKSDTVHEVLLNLP